MQMNLKLVQILQNHPLLFLPLWVLSIWYLARKQVARRKIKQILLTSQQLNFWIHSFKHNQCSSQVFSSLFNQTNNDGLSAVYWSYAVIFLFSFYLQPKRLSSKLRTHFSTTKKPRQSTWWNSICHSYSLDSLQSSLCIFSHFVFVPIQNCPPMGRLAPKT